MHILDGSEAELIQFDNPHVIMLREGKNVEYDEASEVIGGKTIYKSRIRLQEGDMLVAMSDGAIHAGVEMTLNFGWLRENIIDFLETMYDAEFTARRCLLFCWTSAISSTEINRGMIRRSVR